MFMLHGLLWLFCVCCRGYIAWVAMVMLCSLGKQSQLLVLDWSWSLIKLVLLVLVTINIVNTVKYNNHSLLKTSPDIRKYYKSPLRLSTQSKKELLYF